VFCKNVSNVTPGFPFDFSTAWCGRVIQLLSFKFKSEITDEPVECKCAYIHLLYDYSPKQGEQRALLANDIKMLYESDPPVVYMIPVEFILGKLPVVRVGDCGRIPHDMFRHALMRSRNFNGTADEVGHNGKVSNPGSLLYYVNKYALTWSNETPESLDSQ
jgi:hypothetical protein